MTTYSGPATVIADGTEYEVTAQLASTSREWYGSLDVPDGAAAWTIFNADDSKLRVGAREGRFIATDATSAMGIQGSGRPPFGS